MDQQRSALVKHINIKCFSCLPLSLTYVLSLKSSLINHLINDRLLDA